MKKNRVTLLKKLLVALALFICITGESAKACNYTFVTLASTPIDNGDGTYTITIHVCLALTVSWGGTTNFSLTPAGGNFSSIASFTPITITSTYNYCSQCTGNVCTGTMTAVTATAVGTLNGPGNTINFNQTSSIPSTGCTPPAACWGSGFPFLPDDYQSACVSNSNYLCWDITMTTNGYPAFVTLQGAEDDIGPDTWQSGGGCPESVILPPLPCTPPVFVTTPAAICVGQSATLTANGATSYVWSPSTGLSATTGSSVTASPISTTTYTVTGTPGGCTAQVTVTVNQPPTVSVTPNTSICLGQSVNLTASGNATSYTWSPPTGLSSTTGANVTASPTTT